MKLPPISFLMLFIFLGIPLVSFLDDLIHGQIGGILMMFVVIGFFYLLGFLVPFNYEVNKAISKISSL
jgi:hypothetical protein